MNNVKIVFCGLSKNCGETLIKNLKFIDRFIHSYKDYDIRSIVIESDSIDGSLEHLKNLTANSSIELFIENNLESTTPSRIERIAICRNIGLNYIKKNFSSLNDLIYIPYDNDIDLFQNTNETKFMSIIESMLNEKNVNVIFPISEPYYYDIFALRAKGWVNYNAQRIVGILKRKIKLFSFIWNYIFIFRNQLPPNKIKILDVESAFGGIGIYKLNNIDQSDLQYVVSKKDKDFYSEHIEFNKKFNGLKINLEWVIKAPHQHLEYKSQSFSGKMKYILKTIKYDIQNLYKS